MRTDDGTLRLRRKGFLFRRTGSDLETGRPPTASLPEATAHAERVGEKVGGMPTSIVTETVLNIPTTAHILGGACMGADASTGVIDHQHRVFNYEGLYVIDGAAISANPGVNPSLTITALAERAMTFIPPKAGVEPKFLPTSARSAGPTTEAARVSSAATLGTSAA
jgi:cholesterol oxidase